MLLSRWDGLGGRVVGMHAMQQGVSFAYLLEGHVKRRKVKKNSAGKPFSLYLISAVVSQRRFDKSSLISEARKEKKE